MKKCFQILLAITVLVSCGPKPSKSIADVMTDTDAFISKVDANPDLKKEVIEGALADASGFKDIGTFKYAVYFDQQTNELFKINNVEMTDKTISETYYFNAGNLVFIDSDLEGIATKMYVQKNKIISESKTDAATQKLLIEKAKRFQKTFQKDH